MKTSKITLNDLKDSDGWRELAYDLGHGNFAKYIFQYGEFADITIEVDEDLNIIGGRIIPYDSNVFDYIRTKEPLEVLENDYLVVKNKVEKLFIGELCLKRIYRVFREDDNFYILDDYDEEYPLNIEKDGIFFRKATDAEVSMYINERNK